MLYIAAMNDIFEIFRCALNETMSTLKVSQTDLARKLGCSLSKIHSLRSGVRKPYENDSREIASILGFTSYEDFLDIGRAKLGLPIVAVSYETGHAIYFQSSDPRCAKYHNLLDILLHVQQTESECWKQGAISMLRSYAESARITEGGTINSELLRKTLRSIERDNAADSYAAFQKAVVEGNSTADAYADNQKKAVL